MRKNNKLFQQLTIMIQLLLVLFLVESCNSIEPNPSSEKMKAPASVAGAFAVDKSVRATNKIRNR